MRKVIALFFALMCLTALSFAEEELELEDMLSGADPDIVAQTYIAPPSESDDFEMLEDEGEPSIYEKDGSILITITAGGDFTIGRDVRKRADIFGDELEKQGGDINFIFKNISDVLHQDDLTILNFEGTLTESSYIPSEKRENQFLFSAPPAWVEVLPNHSVEAVALENNHVMDHGADALADTKAALSGAGVVYSTGTELGVIDVKGVQIAMLSYLTIDRYDELWDVVPQDIANAKRFYPIVIVSFHWGNETWYYPTDNQVKMGHLAVDSGADLVLGHHSHRINPIEQYKGKYICYSLGNFCFAGNSKPSDMSSFLFQTRFRLKDGEITNEGFRIIPIRISSRTDRNDFVPTVLTKENAIDAVVSTLKENGKRLDYAVDEYPLEWAD
ncbi:MAG: CapA family protein [Clostridiales bacterium]|nr:CapA family protein [Clostridiales bacterium]